MSKPKPPAALALLREWMEHTDSRLKGCEKVGGNARADAETLLSRVRELEDSVYTLERASMTPRPVAPDRIMLATAALLAGLFAFFVALGAHGRLNAVAQAQEVAVDE